MHRRASLNAYYGKHFVEEAMPATDLTMPASDAVKKNYRKTGKKA